MLAIRCASGPKGWRTAVSHNARHGRRGDRSSLCVASGSWPGGARSPGAVRGSVLCPPQAAEVRHDAPPPLCEMVQSQVRADGSASTELIYYERVIYHEKVIVKRVSSVR